MEAGKRVMQGKSRVEMQRWLARFGAAEAA
jgi:hypothetical protein